METTARYMQLMSLCQAVISVYGAYHSYVAIAKLRKYEEISKKLAEWSSEADNQLQKTRKTQAAGAFAVLTTFLVAGYLAVVGANVSPWVRFQAPPYMLAVVAMARYYIKSYWAPGNSKTVGTRVPLPNMEDYNEAQRKTEDLLAILGYLEYGWLGITFVSVRLGWNK